MSRLFYASCRFAPCSQTARRAVRDGIEVAEVDGTWLESFAPGAFFVGTEPAAVSLVHDGPAVGRVVNIVDHGAWWHGDLVFEDGPLFELARERVRVGASISVGCRSLRRHDDVDLRVRRHALARLEHVTILRKGQHAGYRGARITSVWEPKPEPTTRVVDGITRVVDGIPLRAGDQLLGPGDKIIATG